MFKCNEQDKSSRRKIAENDAQRDLDFGPIPVHDEEVKEESEPTTSTFLIQVYSPVFNPNAIKWKFDLGNGRVGYVDISETDIASNAVKRQGSSTLDTYRVEMEVTQGITRGKKMKTSYKVLRVMNFMLGKLVIQDEMF